MLTIRKIIPAEIHLLKDFPPEDWNIDLPQLISFHYGYPYYYPVVADLDGELVGFGSGVMNGKIGWLGNIIVLPGYRKHGIGHSITMHLVDHMKQKGCRGQLLTSSELGLNIYNRIGFHATSTYLFFKGEFRSPYVMNTNIRKVTADDIPRLKSLDQEISGEERFQFIGRYFLTGWVFTSDLATDIRGVYLPDLGQGLIFARDEKAGIELMKFRLSQGKTSAVVPLLNKAAHDFLLSEGFVQFRETPRMVLGSEPAWHQQCVYNRAAGYCG